METWEALVAGRSGANSITIVEPKDYPCQITAEIKDFDPQKFIPRKRARDMPTVEVVLVEEHEPEGPFGAKGVGEIGLVPTAGAVAGALYMHDKIRRYTLPMKDSPAGKAITVGRIRAKDRENWF